jgi:hypothetical protein
VRNASIGSAGEGVSSAKTAACPRSAMAQILLRWA